MHTAKARRPFTATQWMRATLITRCRVSPPLPGERPPSILRAELEPNDALDRAGMVVGFGPVEFGNKTYICPLKGVAPSRKLESRWLNDVAVEQYHWFAGPRVCCQDSTRSLDQPHLTSRKLNRNRIAACVAYPQPQIEETGTNLSYALISLREPGTVPLARNNSDHFASATEAANRSEFLRSRPSLHLSATFALKRRLLNVQACYSHTHTRPHTSCSYDIYRKSFRTAACSDSKRPDWNGSRTSGSSQHDPEFPRLGIK